MNDEWCPTNMFIYTISILATIFLLKYNWQRRYLYYYASKIPGPFSLPLIGCIHIISSARKDFFQLLNNLVETQPVVMKMWLATKLYIVTSRPQDVEIVLANCLEKGAFYEFFGSQIKNSLFGAPVSIWKNHRKLMNHSFSGKIINSYFTTFAKHAEDLVNVLDGNCGRVQTDLASKIWKCSLNITTETLLDLNPPAGIEDNIFWIKRWEQIIIERLHRVWLHFNFLWKLSSLGRECKSIEMKMRDFSNKLVDMKLNELSKVDDDKPKEKHFLNHLLKSNVSRDQIVDELVLINIAGSETMTFTMTYVVLVLGMYPNIQEKVYQEQVSIFGKNRKEPLSEDLNQMDYLERVIKETMRLYPVSPCLARSVDKDLRLDHYVFPAGSNVLIPVFHIHRSAGLWPDPLKFDPDRFLPEQVEKRPRCSYIPFGVGTRNCIGFRFAMTSMKVILSAIVRRFKIETLNWKSVEDIEFDFQILIIPKGYKLMMETRK